MNEIVKPLFDIHQLESISQTILQEAARCGASQAEVGIALNKGFTVGVHDGDVETVEYHQDKVVDIHVYMGQSSGSASLSDFRLDAIKATVQAACHIARFTDQDPAAGLADKDALAFHYPSIEMGCAWPISVENAIELACLCEAEAKAYDPRILNAEQASVATTQSFLVYANSHGFFGAYPDFRHEISCILIAKEGEEMQRDYDYTVTTVPNQLTPVIDVAKQAADRTVKRLGARRLKTMKVPVIYVAEEARSLLGHFAAAISGGNLYRKSSFLLDQIGQLIFPEFVQIEELPHLPHALGSAPFDNDGVATRHNHFITDGVLSSYALGTYSARKLGMQSTGNAGGMHNLTIHPGSTQGATQNLTQLIKTMGTGLLITEMMGHGVNLVTGDYSRGVGGFWVEGGEIQYPVHEVTVAGNLREIYQHMVAVGNDIDKRGNIRTGSILIEEMMIAGD